MHTLTNPPSLTSNLTAYHGTTAGVFSTFTPRIRKGEQLGFGIHFSKDLEIAELYAIDEKVRRKGKAPTIYAVELDIENCLIATRFAFIGSSEYDLAMQLSRGKAITSTDDVGRKCLWIQNAIDMATPERAQQLIQAAGYDGILYRCLVGTQGVNAHTRAAGDAYLVFSPDQVRIKEVLDAKSHQERGFIKVAQTLGDTKVVDADGSPILVYRGEHGPGLNITTRLASISFSTFESAHHYAYTPNNPKDRVINPRVMSAFLDVKRPFLVTDESFLDLSDVEDKLGISEAIRIANKFSKAIESTDQWRRISEETNTRSVSDLLTTHKALIRELYFDAYEFFDDPAEISMLVDKGYDGAIHFGNRETSHAPEYKIFSASQALIMHHNVHTALDDADVSALLQKRVPDGNNLSKEQTKALQLAERARAAVTNIAPGKQRKLGQ